MEIRILRSILRSLRLTEAYLLLAFLAAIGIGEGHAQAARKVRTQGSVSPARITEWQDGVSGGLNLLHTLFPNVDLKSKTLILNNEDWGHPSSKLFSFTIFVCDPNPYPSEGQQQDLLNSYMLHCSGPSMFADFLMGGTQLGPVPGHINIGRPDLDRRWSELSATLQAHPEWSKAQKEEAMRGAGVKYGENSHDEVIGLINDSMKKLEPFLGKLIMDSIDYSPPVQSLSSEGLSIPVWEVDTHPAGQDKKKPWTEYTLIFSAFDGSFESERNFIKIPKRDDRN